MIKAFALVDLDNEIAYGFKVRGEDKNKCESDLRLQWGHNGFY